MQKKCMYIFRTSQKVVSNSVNLSVLYASRRPMPASMKRRICEVPSAIYRHRHRHTTVSRTHRRKFATKPTSKQN